MEIVKKKTAGRPSKGPLTEDTDLSKRQYTILKYMIQGNNNKQIVKLMGTSEATFYRETRKPNFKKRLEEFRSMAEDEVKQVLYSAVGDASSCLIDIMTDKRAKDADRLNAIKVIFDRSIGGVNQRIEHEEIKKEVDRDIDLDDVFDEMDQGDE